MGTNFTDLYCRKSVARSRNPLLHLCIGQSATVVKNYAIYNHNRYFIKEEHSFITLAQQPQWAKASSLSRIPDHTKLDRSPLVE